MMTCKTQFCTAAIPATLAFICLTPGLALAEPLNPPAHDRVFTPEEIARDMGEPSTLTLHLRDVPPGDIFDKVAAQSGVSVKVVAPRGNVSIDCERQPFWTGLQSVLRQTGYDFIGGGGGMSGTVHPAGETGPAFFSGPKVTAGPFIIELNSCAFTLSRRVAFEQEVAALAGAIPTASSNLRVAGEVLCDPKLRIFNCQTNVETLVDDTGKSLLYSTSSLNHMATGGTGQSAQITQIDMAPDPAAKFIKTFAGTVRLQTVVRSKEWEIIGPLQVDTTHAHFGSAEDGLTLTFQARHGDLANPDVIDITLTVAAKNAAIEGEAQSILNGVHWYDAAGKKMDCHSTSIAGTGDGNKMVYRARYELAVPELVQPNYIVLTVPTDIRTVDIPFSFSDLPLP